MKKKFFSDIERLRAMKDEDIDCSDCPEMDEEFFKTAKIVVRPELAETVTGPMNFLLVIEKAGKNYSAHIPDVPGCVATGKTPEETRELIKEALALHFEGLKKDGRPIPKSSTRAEYITITGKTGKRPKRETERMSSAKKAVQDLLERLPEDCTYEDLQYHLYVLQKIQRGIESLEEGKAIPQEEMEKRVAKWFSKKSGCGKSLKR